ncbi:hypothetical protein ACF0H5_013666 [Mactra antiquata]
MSQLSSVHVGVVVIALMCYYMIFSNKSQKDNITELVADEYDYVIVGGGSAGSVLAARLSEDKETNVLLIEAGEFYDVNPLVSVPLNYLDLQNTTLDWKFYTEPQTASCLGLREQRSFWPRGRVLGGTSVLYGLQYTRGSRYDFDEWAASGCEGWSYKEVLPYFLKSEDMLIDELKSSNYHNTGGPMGVSGGEITEMSDLYLKAGQELGYEIIDYNGKDQEGFSKVQISVRNGVRESTGLAYLGRIGRRPNLDIALNTMATMIEINDKRATGVTYIRNGVKSSVKARKEVIISAGVVNSAKLLMLSGIGPREHLGSLSIPVKVDLPVGDNLQDHQMLLLFSSVNRSLTLTDSLVNSFWTKLQYNVFGKGPKSIAGTDGSAFYYVDEKKRGKSSAEIQTILISKYTDNNYFNIKEEIAEEYLAKNGDVEGFTFIVSVTRPKSTGTIRLRSRDPFDYPIIDPKYLTDQYDIDTFIGGIRVWEKYINTPTMLSIGANDEGMKLSFCLQYTFKSDEYWECIVRHLAFTVYHHSGTCKMGLINDPTTVVDPQLKVKGIKGLRVVDTSVFPSVTSGNTNAPVIMMAEKIADKIRGIDSVKVIRDNLPKDV